MSRRHVSSLLGGSDLFAGLGIIERQAAMAILMRGPMVQWPRGSRGALRTGSAGLSLVKAGAVELVATTGDGRELVLAEAADGEVLTCPPSPLADGEVLLSALKDSWICPLDDAHLRDLAPYPSVIAALLEQCVRRTEEAQGAALRLAHRRVDDRVLLALRALTAREGRVTADGVRVGPMRHADLARLANVTRPGATQALAKLERNGLLRREPDGSLLVPRDVAVPASCRRRSAIPQILERVLKG